MPWHNATALRTNPSGSLGARSGLCRRYSPFLLLFFIQIQVFAGHVILGHSRAARPALAVHFP